MDVGLPQFSQKWKGGEKTGTLRENSMSIQLNVGLQRVYMGKCWFAQFHQMWKNGSKSGTLRENSMSTPMKRWVHDIDITF